MRKIADENYYWIFFFLFWFEQAVGIVHSGEETLEEERDCGGEIRTWIQIGAWEV